MPKFEKHIFVCTNQRELGHPRGCCDPQGKAQMQGMLKQKLAIRRLKTTVRALWILAVSAVLATSFIVLLEMTGVNLVKLAE